MKIEPDEALLKALKKLEMAATMLAIECPITGGAVFQHLTTISPWKIVALQALAYEVASAAKSAYSSESMIGKE